MEANIFNIQRFSLHDGSGIRTLVFFKGCPLRCLWCSNPESQQTGPQLMYNHRLCIGCGQCVKVCSAGVLSLGEDNLRGAGGIRIERKDCISCGSCISACPSGALRLVGTLMSINELLEHTLQDRLYFRQSGGGVTLSGGEALMQGEVCRLFLSELHRYGVHTAVETCGYVNADILKSMIPFVDQFLFDYKLHDRQKHKYFTGVDNEYIKANLELLRRCGANILLRIPLIPGVNMNEDHYKGIVSLANDLKLDVVELLPFHQYGKSKYVELGREYQLHELALPDKEEVKRVQRYIADRTKAKIV